MNKKINRLLIYVIGIFVLALGLVLNTKAELGTSAIISIGLVISKLNGKVLGDVVFIEYCVFVVIELLIHFSLKEDKLVLLTDLAQLPFSLVFTRIMNVYSSIIVDGSKIGIVAQYLYIFAAVVITGVGAAMILDTKLVANPADGLTAALAKKFNTNLGLMKNIFDCICLAVTLLICLVNKKIMGIGIGTIISVLAVGRVISIFNNLFKAKINRITGVN